MSPLLSDYDWSENGVIASARQIQSEYWSLVHYSLFIQITTYTWTRPSGSTGCSLLSLL